MPQGAQLAATGLGLGLGLGLSTAALLLGCAFPDNFIPPGSDGGGGSDTGTPDNTVTDSGTTDAGDSGMLDSGPSDSATCVNGALEFDGVDDRVAAADDPALDAFGPITLEAWIRHEGLSGEVQIISHHDHNANQGFVLLMYTNTNLQFRYQDGSSNLQAGGGAGTAVSAGVWHHVAGTFDGTMLRVFIDGMMVADNPIGSMTAADFPGPLRIGAAAYTNGFHYDGTIDEVRISDIARYTAPFTRPTAPFVSDGDTVALWHFDEGSGQDALDATGSHDGTLGDDNSAGSDDPLWVTIPCIEEMP